MADSVMQDWNGPDWPLGVIVVATPGTPVGIMSLVDPNSVNDPSKPVPGTADANEYTQRAYGLIIQGYKKNTDGLIKNTGQIYIVRKGNAGAGNRDDYGAIVATVAPGETFTLDAAPLNRNVFSPYRYSIDADNANDAALVTLLIQ